MLNLKHGDNISFAYDEEEEQWYVFKSKKDGWKLRQKDEESRYLSFNNVAICKKIADSVAYEGKSGRLPFGTEKVIIDKITQDAWPLITAGLKNK